MPAGAVVRNGTVQPPLRGNGKREGGGCRVHAERGRAAAPRREAVRPRDAETGLSDHDGRVRAADRARVDLDLAVLGHRGRRDVRGGAGRPAAGGDRRERGPGQPAVSAAPAPLARARVRRGPPVVHRELHGCDFRWPVHVRPPRRVGIAGEPDEQRLADLALEPGGDVGHPHGPRRGLGLPQDGDEVVAALPAVPDPRAERPAGVQAGRSPAASRPSARRRAASSWPGLTGSTHTCTGASHSGSRPWYRSSSAAVTRSIDPTVPRWIMMTGCRDPSGAS